MNRIERALRGALRYEVVGVQPEAMLNACAIEGIFFSSVEIIDAYTLRLTIREGERQRLEALAPRCRCEAKLVAKTGGGESRRLLKRRLPLLLAAFLVLFGLLLSSLFIWKIELVGAEELSCGRILRALEDSGVSPGVFWPSLDADAVRSRMLTRMPELAWMTVNVHGSKATVLLLRRSEKPEIYRDEAAADLVSGCAGLITRVSVLCGRPLVQPGQAVLRGETLVSGMLDSLSNEPRAVRARAEVMAETWYEITAYCPVQTVKTETSGRTIRRFALRAGKSRVNFYGKGGKALDGYDKIIRETALGADGLFLLPLTLVEEKLIPYRNAPGGAPAAEELQRRLYDRLAEEIDGEILSASFSVSESETLLSVTMHARCLENIARTVYITP